jgi:hypothetical protein
MSSNIDYTLNLNKKLTVHCYILGDKEVFVQSVLADVDSFMFSVHILHSVKISSFYFLPISTTEIIINPLT